MQIGPYVLPNAIFVAPMAGVTDRPFRQLCRQFGAGYAVSEMVTSRKDLWKSLKTSRRANHDGEPGPIAVQIAGTDAPMMAEAAAYNIDQGAQIIDINMGCPAKKVCNKWAGSALMQNEKLAIEIAEAVVTGAPSGDKLVRIVTLTTPSLPLVDALLTESQKWDSATLLNRQILMDEGPWRGTDMTIAWELYFQAQGLAPAARCGQQGCAPKQPHVLLAKSDVGEKHEQPRLRLHPDQTCR